MEIVKLSTLPADPLSGDPLATTLSFVAKSVTGQRTVDLELSLPDGLNLDIVSAAPASASVKVKETPVSIRAQFRRTGALPPIFNVMATVTIDDALQFTCSWAVHA